MTFPEVDAQLAEMTRNFLEDTLRLGRINRIMVDQFVTSVELLCAENAEVLKRTLGYKKIKRLGFEQA